MPLPRAVAISQLEGFERLNEGPLGWNPQAGWDPGAWRNVPTSNLFSVVRAAAFLTALL